MGEKMPIVQDVLKNVTEALNYEVEGIRKRWDRRLKLIQKIKQTLLGHAILRPETYNYYSRIRKNSILY